MPDIDQKHKASLSDDYHKGVEAARNGVPRWKQPYEHGYSQNERKREAWYAGHDAETTGARPAHEVRSNMPEATAPADIVAMHAVALLNDDAVGRNALSEEGRSLTIRGVTLEWDEDVALRVLHPTASASQSFGYSYVSPQFRDVFFEVSRSWHQRRRDELCAPMAKKIAGPEAPPQPAFAPEPKRSWFRRIFG